MFNGNSVATLSFNQLNTGHTHQQVSDDPVFEQLYQFQQYRDSIPINSTTNSM
jgi:hypothetical protein